MFFWRWWSGAWFWKQLHQSRRRLFQTRGAGKLPAWKLVFFWLTDLGSSLRGLGIFPEESGFWKHSTTGWSRAFQPDFWGISCAFRNQHTPGLSGTSPTKSGKSWLPFLLSPLCGIGSIWWPSCPNQSRTDPGFVGRQWRVYVCRRSSGQLHQCSWKLSGCGSLVDVQSSQPGFQPFGDTQGTPLGWHYETPKGGLIKAF